MYVLYTRMRELSRLHSLHDDLIISRYTYMRIQVDFREEDECTGGGTVRGTSGGARSLHRKWLVYIFHTSLLKTVLMYMIRISVYIII